MIRRLAIITALLTAAATTSVVLSEPASAAGVTSSTITSPTSGSHYLITDVSPSTMVTVTGTTTGGTAGDLVDIRCYEGRGQWEESAATNGVPIDGAGNFSVQMSTEQPYGTCILRAVPHGYPGNGSLTAFTGPKLTTEYDISYKVPTGPNAGIVYNYDVELVSAHALNGFHGVTSSGYSTARLQYADGTSSNYFWDANASLSNIQTEPRATLQVDGTDSYGPSSARVAYPGAQDVPGFPALTYSVARDAGTGVVTIHETDPFVVCPVGAPYPPTQATCPTFTSAGVRLERTIVIDDGGLQVHVDDRWRSTDGKAHTLSARYADYVDGTDSATGSELPTAVGLKLPWLSSSYQPFSGSAVLDGPSRVPATLFVRDELAAPDGDVNHPRGAETLDVAPSKVERSRYDMVTLPTSLAVPAGGTRLVRRAYVMGTSQKVVDAKASVNAKRLNPYRPDGSIKVVGASAYVGNNVYSSLGTHETTTASRRRGARATFLVRVQNDGTTADSIKVRAPSGSSSFSVHYYAGSTGSQDITAAVLAGTYTVSGLAPGASRSIRVVVTVRSRAGTGTARSWLVTTTSAHDSTRRDAVKAVVRVAAG